MRLHKAHIREESVRLFRRLFPERQIFLRSRGEVRYIKLSPARQAVAAVLLLTVFGWVATASLAFLTRDARLAAKERQLDYVGEELDSLVGELERLKREALTRTERLEARQRLLESLVDADPPASGDGVARGRLPEAQSGGEPAAEGSASALPASEPEERARPSSAPLLMTSVTGGRGLALTPVLPSERFARASDALDRRLKAVAAYQEAAARLLAERQAERIAEVSAAVQRLGLSPRALIARSAANPAGMGGPVLPQPAAQRSPAFALLEERLQTHGLLMQSFRSIPSRKPADKFYLSSRFGPRRDPFTRRWSSHSGLDLAGWPGETILAAGPGVVRKAGRDPAYGRMVEIDHGNGFRTRYGHMRKLLVTRGERVDRGQPIGEMGSTGRSTSTHLHWEVWLDGELVDPLPFLKGADDVYALQRRYESNAS